MTNANEHIIIKPNNLNISNDVELCPICKISIVKKNITERRCITECSECNYDDRPFGIYRKDKGRCECVWGYINILYFTCNNCGLLEEEQIRIKQIKVRDYLKTVKQYVSNINNITNINFIPIKLAVNKYIEQIRVINNLKYIQNNIIRDYKEILVICKIKNR